MEEQPQWMRDRFRHIENSLNRMECQRQDLIDHLHKETAFHLFSNFEVILLPAFNVKQMVSTSRKRKLNRNAVHNMLSLRQGDFKTFLLWIAKKYNKAVIIVNESYTSKTCTVYGSINEKLGGSKFIRHNKMKIDRDIKVPEIFSLNIFQQKVFRLNRNCERCVRCDLNEE